MSPQPNNAKSIFLEAVEKYAPDQWPGYLKQACGDDFALRKHVEALLKAHGESNRMLDGDGLVATIDTGPAAEKLGTTIGRYKLVHEMGQGGMGTVYMAVQKEPVKRKVALKVIKPGMDTREVVARFEAERQALALMDHQSIATVLDGGSTDSGRPYFVMELVVGTPITEYCDECRYTTRQRLELFTQVCNAVQHAHQKGVIHRDIKPSNILVTMHDAKPVPKVIDFGIAKAIHQPLTDQSLHTHAAQMIGTPLYMSPEQAHRTGQDVDTRTDVFSLGVLLYELLTGTTPFDKERLQTSGLDEFKRIIREEEPPRPSTRLSTVDAALETVADKHSTDLRTLSQELSGELDWIVMKALEKDRSRRYESASDFAKDVQRHLDDEPVEACPPSTAYRLGKFYRRNKITLLTAVAFALVTIVGAGIAGWQAVVATGAKNFAKEQQGVAEQRLLDVAEQRERAEANFQKAIDAVDEMLTQVADEDLADIPRMEPVRCALLERALAFYLGFVEEEGEDPEVQQEAAKAQKRAGDILSLLGEDERAEKHYQEAIKRFEAIPAQDGQHGLAESLIALAKLLENLERYEKATEVCNQAISIERTLVAQFPKEAEYRSSLASTLNTFGTTLLDTGQSEEAVKAYREAIDVGKQLAAEFPNVAEYRFKVAVSHQNLGLLLKEMGRQEEAEASYRESLETSNQLVADLPKVPEYRVNFANSHRNLGILLKATGRHEEAEASYRESLTIDRRLAADFPHVPKYRSNLAGSHNNLGELLRGTGRQEEAEASYREALEIWKQLAAGFPGVPEYLSDLAASHNNLGILLGVTGRQEEAKVSFREALQAWKQLAADLPKVPEHRYRVTASLLNLGNLLMDTGRLEEAEKALQESIDVGRQLVAEFSETPAYRSLLAHSQNSLGGLLKRRGRNDEAEASYRESLENKKQLVADFPEVPEYRSSLAGCHNNLGLQLREMGRYEEAEASCQESLEIKKQLVADFPETPSYRSALARSQRTLGNLHSERGRKEEAEASYLEALKIRERLLADSPDVLAFCRAVADTHGSLATLMAAEGRIQEAEASLGKAVTHYRESIRRDPDSPVAYDDLARLLATFPHVPLRNPSQAVELAEKAVQFGPEVRLYWHTLGIAQYRAGKWQEASEALQKSETLAGGDEGHAWFFLAMATWQLGNKEEARRWYDKAVTWMDENQPLDEELKRFRAEATELLGISDTVPQPKEETESTGSKTVGRGSATVASPPKDP